MPLKLIVTKDGSHSVFNPDLNETYHSQGGAIQESQYIYIDCGLKTLIAVQPKVKVLEVGFGTGLNAILTLAEARTIKAEISYTTIEPYPLPQELVKELNYPSFFEDPYLKEKFYTLHNEAWDETIQIDRCFSLRKINTRLEDYTAREKYDIVYYDAFAPSKQVEIWNIENLKKVKNLLTTKGILVTYCSSGKFKRDLKEVGFQIESLPGPLGKREITRAMKITPDS